VNRGQELVIGGYVPGTHGLDFIIVGFYRGRDLIYVARVRNGFVPASRRQLFEKLRPLVIPECPFANLPETHRSRWGEGLTPEDMKKCVWLRPELVSQIEFLEWTERTASGIQSLSDCDKTRMLEASLKSRRGNARIATRGIYMGRVLRFQSATDCVNPVGGVAFIAIETRSPVK
jgi:hypothetical protein